VASADFGSTSKSVNRPLRIGVFGIRTIPSTYSGYETFCNVLLPELVARGHDVTLFTREKFGRSASYKGVKKIGLPSIRTKQLDTISHSFICAAVARFGQFDVVLSFNVANAPSLLFLTKTGVPTVLNVDGQEWKRGKWGKLARSTFYNCGKMSRITASRLITDCLEMQAIYRREFKAESSVIPYCWTNLMSGEEVEARGHQIGELAKFELKSQEYVVTGGRLVPENNIAEIVESHINSSWQVPIAVLGKANYDSPVQKKLYELAMKDDRVRLLGHISNRRDFGIILKESLAYLHGHSVGGINPSIVEAMGVGALICAYDTPFNREALGEAGLYFEDPKSASVSCETLVKSQKNEHLRCVAIERVKEHYSQKKIVDLYEANLISAAQNTELANEPSFLAGNDTRGSIEDLYKSSFGLTPVWHDLSATNTPTFYRFFGKRLLDIIVSLGLIVIFSPILVVLIVLVRVILGEEVFYRQTRIGRYGKPFEILKLRTMTADRRRTIKAVSKDRRVLGHKTSMDPRHTKFGLMLRKFGLDEIPQLFNVLKGDMSMVGPRPEIESVAKRRGYFLHVRHLLRPGITGPYQLSELRSSGDLELGLALDKEYVESVGLWTDFENIISTPYFLFRRRNLGEFQ